MGVYRPTQANAASRVPQVPGGVLVRSLTRTGARRWTKRAAAAFERGASLKAVPRVGVGGITWPPLHTLGYLIDIPLWVLGAGAPTDMNARGIPVVDKDPLVMSAPPMAEAYEYFYGPER
jgi:hypothetical protein